MTSRRYLSCKTYQGYQGDVARHLKPRFGHLKLTKLEPLEIQRWQDGLEKEKGPYVAKNVSATLSSALTKAVRWRFLERSPYEKGAISRIVVPEVKADYWEPSEAARFITADVTRQHPYFVAYYLTLNLGFRMGELRGLMWQDIIHLKNKHTGKHEPHIHVQRQAISDRHHPTFSNRLKTRTSNRILPLPINTFNLLQPCKQDQKSKGALQLGTIIEHKSGGVPTIGHLRKEFYRLSKLVDVPGIKFHGLRHTAGSLWLEAGVSLLRASRWLGHSNMRTTEKIYIHLLKEACYGESLSLERMLGIEA